MKKISILSLATLILLLPLSAKAGDAIGIARGDFKIFRHGVETEVLTKEHKEFIKRMRMAFATNTVDTSTVWFKNEFIKGGVSLDDQWNAIKSASYISFIPQKNNRAPTPRNDRITRRTDMEEVIFEIMETPAAGLFGRAMAKFPDGEIRGYEIADNGVIPLFCVDIANKYLPDHYAILTKKYSSEPYKELNFNCTTQ